MVTFHRMSFRSLINLFYCFVIFLGDRMTRYSSQDFVCRLFDAEADVQIKKLDVV